MASRNRNRNRQGAAATAQAGGGAVLINPLKATATGYFKAHAANVTLDEANVDAWADTSDDGVGDPLAATGGTEPQFVASDEDFNGKPVILFAAGGSPDALNNAVDVNTYLGAQSGNKGYSSCVISIDGSLNDNAGVPAAPYTYGQVWGDIGGYLGLYAFNNTTPEPDEPTLVRYSFGGSSPNVARAFVLGAPMLVEWATFEGESYLAINGGAWTVQGSSVVIDNGAGTLRLGGQGAVDSTGLDMRMAELLFRDSVPTTQQRAAQLAYVTAEYGIAA